jgi:LDH2 family malate/lactate/ureidoglycolate dehydrogenase
MTTTDRPRPTTAPNAGVRLDHADLVSFAATLFQRRGVPVARARRAAATLCYGDLAGLSSHGLANLTRLYLPLFEQGRVDPVAEPQVLTDLGACALVDARRALGLWAAAEAMESAVARAARHGIGLVSVRGGTHVGCAGAHALVAADADMIGVVATNCGGQRIARPPGGALAMLGTNPLSVAAPALDGHPYVLDMSTTVVPTGRVREAARHGRAIPAGWLADDAGATVTDPAAFDRGEAHLRWLGGEPDTGAFKGFGLGLAVELLAAALPGAQRGPAPAALDGDGGPHGRDDDIGYLVLAISPRALRPDADTADTFRELFGTVLSCPPLPGRPPVRYPGWLEAERAAGHLRDGVPVADDLYGELVALGFTGGVH